MLRYGTTFVFFRRDNGFYRLAGIPCEFQCAAGLAVKHSGSCSCGYGSARGAHLCAEGRTDRLPTIVDAFGLEAQSDLMHKVA